MTNYVLICKNNKEDVDRLKIENIFIHKINKETFSKLKFSQIHKKNLILIDKDKHEEFNNFRKMFSDNNILLSSGNTEILLIPELEKNELLLYIGDYVQEYNFAEFKKILKMNLYYQNSINIFDIKKKLCAIMENLDNFWEKYNVTNINLTDNFKFKKFNLNTYEKNKNKSEELTNKDIDYLNEITNYSEENIKQKNIYYRNENVDIDYDEVTNIYNILNTEYMKYCFLANLLCSKTHCHLVLKNKNLLIQSKDIVDKYKIAFKYFFSYGWMTFMSYELFTKNINDNDLYIMDIDTVNLLPKFPFTYDDINQNPYSCMIVDENEANVKNNMLSLDFNENYEYYNGTTTSNEFSRRLNIFCNRKNEKGILKFIDWDSCVITGSVVCACSINGYNLINSEEDKTNSTKKIMTEVINDIDINNDKIKEIKLNDYTDGQLNEYYNNDKKYKNSDIDIICNKESYFDFNNIVYELFTKISDEDKTTKLSSVVSSIYTMNEDMLNKDLNNLKKIVLEQNYNIKVKEFNINTIKLFFGKYEIKKYFYEKYYVNFKHEQNERYLNVFNAKYKSKKINKEDDNLFYIKYSINCEIENFNIKMLSYDATLDNTKIKENEKLYFDNTDSNKIVAKITESSRYKIDMDNVKTLEIFRCKNKNFMSSISNFHFAMVRGYWDGKTLKCMPSLASASMINLSWDNKYFASITHPAKIINKYRLGREKSIIINNNCKREILIHMLKNSDEYKEYDISNINEDISEKVKKIFKFCHNKENNNIKRFDETFDKIIIKNLGFMNKLKSINENGSVNPLNKKYIDIFYEEINKDNRKKILK